MGPRKTEEDVEKSLTTGMRERKRSIVTKQPQKHQTRSAFLGVLTAVVILSIVTAIAIAVYEKNKVDGCGPYIYPGINISDLTPKIISQQSTCNIEGDCWTGEQCYECFRLDIWEVGNINDIPVCCPQCNVTKLSLSNNSCHCRHDSQ